MKKLISILYILVFFSVAYSQPKDLKIELSTKSNPCDTCIRKLYVTITNNSTVDKVLWISKIKNKALSVDGEIKEYFFKREGDFSFADIIYEDAVINFQSTILLTFIKKLSSKEAFTFEILLDRRANRELKRNIIERIITIPVSELEEYFDEIHLEKFYYPKSCLQVAVEELK